MRMKSSDVIRATLAWLLSVSMVALIWITGASSVEAHEVQPMIGDMEEIGGALTFRLDGSFESIVAGIDLDGLQDTENAPGADQYDRLRAMEPDAFAAELEGHWPQMAEAIEVVVDGAPVTLDLRGVSVPEVGDVEVARTSVLQFAADLPQGAREVQIGWPAEYGVLVLRQMGVEDGWDGYLAGGGLTDPVALTGGSDMSALTALFDFMPVGVQQIVPLGLDHILFVLGLFLLSARAGPVLLQVAAFSGGLLVTLALGTLGNLAVPDSAMWIVEAIIGASIVYVGVANLLTDRLHPWRPVLVFGFGLAHGLALATMLGAFGLPDGAVVPALLGFAIGVELGLLVCIAVAFIVVASAIRLSEDGKVNRLAAAVYLGFALVVTFCATVLVRGAGAEMTLAYFQPLVIVAVLAGLCAASCAVERFDTYRHMVAMPASVAIALTGAYQVFARVFL